MFSIPLDRIRQTSLAVSVMNYDRIVRNDRIGQQERTNMVVIVFVVVVVDDDDDK